MHLLQHYLNIAISSSSYSVCVRNRKVVTLPGVIICASYSQLEQQKATSITK